MRLVKHGAELPSNVVEPPCPGTFKIQPHNTVSDTLLPDPDLRAQPTRAQHSSTRTRRLCASPRRSASRRPAGSSERRGMNTYPPDQQHSCKAAETCRDSPGPQLRAPSPGKRGRGPASHRPTEGTAAALTGRGRAPARRARAGAASRARRGSRGDARRRAGAGERGSREGACAGTWPRHGEGWGRFLRPGSQAEGAAQAAAPGGASPRAGSPATPEGGLDTAAGCCKP